MSQKTDNMIKLALVFFVSLLSFSIGTYVGKKYSDNQYKLSQLEPQKSQPTTPPAHGEEFATEGAAGAASEAKEGHEAAHGTAAVTESKPAALTDSEVAKIAEEFATEDSTQDISDGEPIKTVEADEKEIKTIPNSEHGVAVKTIPSESKKVAGVPINTIKPALAKIKDMEPSTEERVPASIPAKKEVTPTPVTMHFTVQIGSYPTLDEAEKMTKDLQSKGYKTTYVPAKINGQTWYRVSVGLFGSIREAQDYKKEFLEKTKLSSAIVQRVQQ